MRLSKSTMKLPSILLMLQFFLAANISAFRRFVFIQTNKQTNTAPTKRTCDLPMHTGVQIPDLLSLQLRMTVSIHPQPNSYPRARCTPQFLLEMIYFLQQSILQSHYLNLLPHMLGEHPHNCTAELH